MSDEPRKTIRLDQSRKVSLPVVVADRTVREKLEEIAKHQGRTLADVRRRAYEAAYLRHREALKQRDRKA